MTETQERRAAVVTGSTRGIGREIYFASGFICPVKRREHIFQVILIQKYACVFHSQNVHIPVKIRINLSSIL